MMIAILTATAGLLALAVLVQTARLRALREHLAETAVDDAWADALEPYFDEHDSIGIDADARSPKMLLVTEHADRWELRQILDDPAAHHDWGISAVVDLTASDEAGHPVIEITDAGRL